MNTDIRHWVFVLSLLQVLAAVVPENLEKDIQQYDSRTNSLVHSRKRRYVVFPEGSTLTVSKATIEWTASCNKSFLLSTDKIYRFQVATSLQIAACVSPTALSGTGAIFTNGVAWALSYDLPNETIHSQDRDDDFPTMIKRHKRDLFVRVEKLMNSAGIDGRSCMLKTVCETAQNLKPRHHVFEEILRLLFTYPSEKGKSIGSNAEKHYVKAHRAGESSSNCNDLFPCPFSLLELGLGFLKYPQIPF